MNAEASARSRKAVKVWIALLALAALVAVILLTSRSTRQWNETVTFKLLDYDSHQSISNFTVTIYRRWTAIPLEKLTLRAFNPWRETKLTSADATIKVFVPAAQLRTYVVFDAPGYERGVFARLREDVISTGRRPPEQLAWTNQITIELEPLNKEAQP